MFRVSFLCEDTKLPTMLKLLAQHEAFNVEPQPVVDSAQSIQRMPSTKTKPAAKSSPSRKFRARARKHDGLSGRIVDAVLAEAFPQGVRPKVFVKRMEASGLTSSAFYHPISKRLRDKTVVRENGLYRLVNDPNATQPVVTASTAAPSSSFQQSTAAGSN